MTRPLKWIVAVVVTAAVFAVGWYITESLLHFERGDALQFAGPISAIPLALLGVWATQGKDSKSETATMWISNKGRSRGDTIIVATNATGAGSVTIDGIPGKHSYGISRTYGRVPLPALNYERRTDHYTDLSDFLHASMDAFALMAILGPKGVGKSQIAGDLARSGVDLGYSLVAWIPGDSVDSLVAALGEIAENMQLTVSNGTPESVARKTLAYIENASSNSLMIVDNVDDWQQVSQFVPRLGKCHVVITTTERFPRFPGNIHYLPVFQTQTAEQLLLNWTGLEDRAGASALSEELGRLPLALGQAAAVIKEQRLDFGSYRQRLLSLPVGDYLPAASGDPYPLGAAEAVLISLEKVYWRDSPAVTYVLDCLATLAPDGFPRAWLPPTNELDFAVSQLLRSSIVNYDQDERYVSCHRLVRRIVCESNNKAGRARDALTHAVSLLEPHLALPDEQSTARIAEAERLIAHVTSILEAEGA